MAIPSTGAISLNTIQTEFGGTNPISINEYYAGGTNVPAGTSGTNGAVPSSGQISFNSFYGTQKHIPFSVKVVFTDNTTWTVPSVTSTFRVKAWGAGGGASDQNKGAQYYGGAGGFSQADISLTPGSTAYVAVGGGGGVGAQGAGIKGGRNGGGLGNTNLTGSGGGFSGVFTASPYTQASAKIVAGGGGGTSTTQAAAISGGGGSPAGQGNASTAATSSAAGTPGGSALQGGSITTGSSNQGGGGGGYFGGGYGASTNGRGGGGSGYVTGSNTTTTTATTQNPPNTSDPDYVAGKGISGTSTPSTYVGGDGYVVIIY